MPDPTFNSVKIFNSVYSTTSGDSRCEGVCMPLDYSKIFQEIHFEGENGSWWLDHGWPDRNWTFEGNLYGNTGEVFGGILVAIEQAIDDATADISTWQTLTDTFGRSYTYAQIRKLTFLEKPHITADGGYVCTVRVEGVIGGMSKDQGD